MTRALALACLPLLTAPAAHGSCVDEDERAVLKAAKFACRAYVNAARRAGSPDLSRLADVPLRPACRQRVEETCKDATALCYGAAFDAARSPTGAFPAPVRDRCVRRVGRTCAKALVKEIKRPVRGLRLLDRIERFCPDPVGTELGGACRGVTGNAEARTCLTIALQGLAKAIDPSPPSCRGSPLRATAGEAVSFSCAGLDDARSYTFVRVAGDGSDVVVSTGTAPLQRAPLPPGTHALAALVAGRKWQARFPLDPIQVLDCTPGIDCPEVCAPPVLAECHENVISVRNVESVVAHGANGTDEVDDTPAFQQAIDALPFAAGGIVLIPAGRYLISDTLVIDKAAAVHLLGIGVMASSLGSVLEWRGPADEPLLRLVGLNHSRFEGFGILARDPNHPLDVGIQSETATGRSTTMNTFTGVRVDGRNGYLTDGFRFITGDDAGYSGGDQGNDCHCFERVNVSSYTGSAFRLMHPSSRDHLFVHILYSCNKNPVGRSGLSTAPAPGRFGGGGFTWLGGGGGNCTVADFELAQPLAPVFIEGNNTETSVRSIVSVGPSVQASAAGVSYRASRFARNQGIDDPVVSYDVPGPLVVDGNLFAFRGTTRVEMAPPAPATLRLANNAFFDLAGDVDDLDDDVADVSSVVARVYGNQFTALEEIGGVTVPATSTATTTTPPPPLAAPAPAGPDIAIGALPPPNPLELLLDPIFDVTVEHGTPPSVPAVPDDAGDDTVGIQAALDAAETHPQGGIVHLPAGTYRVSDTLEIGVVGLVKLRGDGSDVTTLEWYGAPDVPLLLLDAQRDAVVAYLSIRAVSPLATGIRVQSLPVAAGETALRRSSNNAFYDVVVAGADFGWRIAPGVGPDGHLNDGNNEEHYFVECVAEGFAQAGWSIEHRQSKANQFVQSAFDGLNVGRYGVATVFGSSLGSFHWLGGGGRRVTEAAFGLGGSSDVILIRDGVFPGTPRLLESGVARGAWNINLYRNHWSSFSSSDRIIEFLKAGPLVLEGNLFELFLDPPADARIFHESVSSPASLTAIGNELRWTASTLGGPGSRFDTPAQAERTLRGNTYRDASGLPLVRASEP